jgi:hypothetical protein
MILVITLGVRVNGVIVDLTALYPLIQEIHQNQYQLEMAGMKSAVTSSSSVAMLQENASPRGGNATTTKIVKMARTNMTVLPLSVMLVNSLVIRTNSTQPTVSQAIFDVIKSQIAMINPTNQIAIIAPVRRRIINAATASACPRKRSATGTLTVATKRTRLRIARVLPATSPNSDVPTAKSA